MSRKTFLPPFHSLVAGDVSQATLSSAVTDVSMYDDIAIQYIWTGTASGTVAIEGSLDYNPQNPSIATWTAIPGVTPTNPAGSGGNALFNITLLGVPYIRVKYTKGSGTGTLDVWISAKGA